MAFLIFIAANAALFLRPSELFPELAEVQLYLWLISAALIASVPAVLRQLTPASLRENPTTVCVLAMLPAIVISHPPELWLWGMRTAAFDFAKVTIYYLVLVAVVNSERRLKAFLACLALLICASAALPLLHRASVVHLPSLEAVEQKQFDRATGEVVSYPRLRSTGIFNDPNDFAMILVAGMAICLYFLGGHKSSARLMWLPALALCAYAFWLTRSRGGMLAMLAAVAVLAYARWGWRRAVIAGMLVAPVVAAGFAGRGEAMESGTGQQRVQLWSQGLVALRAHPFFGIGYDNFVEEVRHVAHNSFVHSYTELGVIGGTAFFGVYAFSVWTLLRLRGDEGVEAAPDSRRLLAAVTALLAGFAVSQLSLSRAYVVPTYMAAGLATVVAQVLPIGDPDRLPKATPISFTKLAAASLLFLAALMVYVRFAARWT